jgi:hypothetical protein
MKSRTWLGGLAASLVALCIIAVPAGSQGRGRGKGKKEKVDKSEKRERKEERREDGYSQHDRDEVRSWYRDHENNLPPGLAKRDRLPPGLERQLRVRGTLPPGLRDKIEPAPPEFVEMLPPPPPDCEHAFIGGHLVLLNRRTFLILDIFHFER